MSHETTTTTVSSPDVWQNRIVNHGTADPATLVANPLNWRTHPAKQKKAMQGVLNKLGWIDDVIINRTTGRMIDGHLRVHLSVEAKATSVPVKYVELSEEEEALALATFDPLGALAEANAELLETLLKQVQTDDPAIEAMLAELADDAGIEESEGEIIDAEAQIDRAEELRQKWGVEAGQLWQLGEHRIICGDSRDGAVFERVLAGDKASLVFTDPPYGVAIGAKNRLLNSVQKSGRNLTDIVDDELPPEKLKEELLPAFINVKEVAMAEDCTVFVTAPQGGELGMMMLAMMKEAGLPVRHVLIWKKNAPTFSMGRLDYDYQHEPILLTWGKRHKRPMRGAHRTSVWEIDKPRKSEEHPTMKPVELVINALLNNSDKGDVVFDAYSGSGTTVMACETQKRKARVVELSPAYVAVAIQRWVDATGKTPMLIDVKGEVGVG